jgi:hypothetical protein
MVMMRIIILVIVIIIIIILVIAAVIIIIIILILMFILILPHPYLPHPHRHGHCFVKLSHCQIFRVIIAMTITITGPNNQKIHGYTGFYFTQQRPTMLGPFLKRQVPAFRGALFALAHLSNG